MRIAGLVHKCRRFAFLGLAVFSFFVSTAFAQADPAFYPVALCIVKGNDGSFNARFGYVNETNALMNVPVGSGSGNYFYSNLASSPEDRGQPSVFKSGRHYMELEVPFAAGESSLTWKLGHEDATASLNDQECGFVMVFPNCATRGQYYDSRGDWVEELYTHFGYVNTGAEPKTIGVGHENCAKTSDDDEAVCDHSQLTVFEPGQHDGVLSMTGKGGDAWARWDLYDEAGNSLTGAYQDWETRQCDVKPVSNCITEKCSIEGQSGDYTAWFGYDNQEPFTVNIPVGNGNMVFPQKGCSTGTEGSCVDYQPTTFSPGVHKKVFGVCMEKGPAGVLGWNVNDEKSLLTRIYSLIYGADWSPYIPGIMIWNLGGMRSCDGSFTDCILDIAGSVAQQVAVHYYVSVLAEDLHSKICNRAPVCSAGGDYAMDCAGVINPVFLNGLASTDPDGDAVDYSWSTTCAKSTLFEAASGNPILSLKQPGEGQAQDCAVSLTVKEKGTDEGLSSTCSAGVSVSACTLDCLGDPYGRAALDLCGKCSGNNACVDCMGVVNGTARLDRFGVCNGDGTSGLGCSETDVSPALFLLSDTNRQFQNTLERGVRAIRAARKNKRYGRSYIISSRKLTDQNMSLIASMPGQVENCLNSSYCVKVANNADKVETFRANMKALGKLGASVAAGIRRTGSRSLSSRYSRNMTYIVSNALALLGKLPATTSKCR